MYIGQNVLGDPTEYESFFPEKCVELECFLTAFEAEYASTYLFKGELHNFWELFCVTKGNVCVSADERILHLSAGDAVFHKPMELHRFHIEHDSPVSVFVLSFAAKGHAMEMLKNCVLHLSPGQQELLKRIILLIRGDAAYCLPHSASLAALKKNPLQFQKLTCLVEFFLLWAAQSREPVSATVDSPEIIVYQKAIRIMEAHAANWPCVQEIAASCHVSASYLKNIFKKYAGLGVHQYFLKTKIIHASRMLEEGESVSEIAAALGFSSPNYFSFVYKRETGITPSEYRKSGIPG